MPQSNTYKAELIGHFVSLPSISSHVVENAATLLNRIEKMLYNAPSFIDAVKASTPKIEFRAVLTDDQSSLLKKGAVKLMTKKDGTILATLVDPETHRTVSNVALEKIELPNGISQCINNFMTQMQLAQIAEQMQSIQLAIEEVQRGQESDRLAMAYSCQQKLIQAMAIKNEDIKVIALMHIVSDAEDSRNLLMRSQAANAAFIASQPESFWGKLTAGVKTDTINAKILDIREGMLASTMVSLAEAMAYQELGEYTASRISLKYYANYIENTYLSTPDLIKRLDMLDPSPENYWSKTLPLVAAKIQRLPDKDSMVLIGGETNGTSPLQKMQETAPR